MSIVALSRITLVGHLDDKLAVLFDLQTLGCLHLIPLRPDVEPPPAEGPSTEAREALRFLLSAPQKRRQVFQSADFDPVEVERRALDCRNRLQNLRDRRDFLARRIADLKPWGYFDLTPMSALQPLKFWFYVVPHYQVREVAATQTCWDAVNRDHRFSYIVVISEQEPDNMPVPRTHTGAVPLSDLEQELEWIESAIEDAEVDRYRLTRWGILFARNIGMLDDRKALEQAARQAQDQTPLFGIQAWSPTACLPAIERYAAEHGLFFAAAEPSPEECPPTLLRNPEALAGGEDLVTFYTIPGYWTWDPSIVVLFSFALFFAMILADAGYGAVLGLIAWRYWGRMRESDTGRRLRIVWVFAVATSLLYGVMTGSYFGIRLPAESWLRSIQVLDVHRHETMMTLCVLLGAAHVMLGNLIKLVRHRRSVAAWPPLGWILIIGGGLLLWADLPPADGWSSGMIAVGALLVLAFSAPDAGPAGRLAKGLLNLLIKLPGAFGDVMSYLRLFALGLASASLANAFNEMALHAKLAMPGPGLLAFVLILVIGHLLNFLLGLMSAVVHSLRLNYIEFFNWSLTDEGHLFSPFKRKGGELWKA